MKQIIAIGGGAFSKKESSLVPYILQQSGKTNPKVCFLPQASGENKEYIVRFFDVFLDYNARTSWISFFGTVEQTWHEHLLNQDIIFVGGGNTRSMLALWREWGVDKILRQAYEKGIVLAGVSAGAICWFEQGLTDSVWPLGALDCLGFVSGSCCPHYDSEAARKPAYRAKVAANEIAPGIALEDDVAAHYIDGQLTAVVTRVKGKKAYALDGDTETAVELTII
jgi:dipeptidase E